MTSVTTDALVIGGGFFGCRVSLHLRSFLPAVTLVEQEADLLQRASYNNQARVHQGYHYPRSLLTALRSRVNFGRFIEEYPECVARDFAKYYAISRIFSHVTAGQFRAFCERIEAPLETAPAAVRRLFDPDRIEEVFTVKEWAFDSVKLKLHLARDLAEARVQVETRTRVGRLSAAPNDAIDVELIGPQGPRVVRARQVFNCTYSGINQVLAEAKLPLIPLKHEATELALVEPPAQLLDLGVTVMCGPFFSIMPFPPRGLHSLSHVRYTPHHAHHEHSELAWAGGANRPDLETHFELMVRDAARYLPCIRDCRYQGSLRELKTVLPASEQDDSRPILFRAHHGLRNLVCVMGGKIDNVYDVLQEMDELRHAGTL